MRSVDLSRVMYTFAANLFDHGAVLFGEVQLRLPHNDTPSHFMTKM